MSVINARVPLLGGTYAIRIEGERLESVEPASISTDVCVGPALFDIQVNGFGGRTCTLASPDEKDVPGYISRIMREHGVGSWIPTVTTNAPDVLATAFSLLGEALDEDADAAASIPGLHLEGPYISAEEGPRGAHPLSAVRPADWDEFQRLQELSGGRILYVTVAPETEGCMAFIRKAVASGVVVSLGHTAMDRDTHRAAVDAGATMSTHLGNGAHDRVQRHNNYIWYQLACRRSFASFVTDGHHLPDECLYAMLHAKGLDLSIITSDCTRYGGLKPGVYGEVEKLPSGRLTLRGTPNLAGSANHLLDCVEHVERAAQISHADAWRLATCNPARMLGLDDRIGIEQGKPATLTVYRRDEQTSGIDVLETWVAGRKFFDAATTERVALPDGP